MKFWAAMIAAFVFAEIAYAETPDLAAMCGTNKICKPVKTTPAGKDANGRALSIVELNLGPEDDGGFKCRPYKREYWLRVAGGKPERILALCNDGYGASGVGEDRITVGANRITHFQKGGSAWRWSWERVIGLVPFRIASEDHCSYHNLSSGFTRTHFDWRTFKGEVSWRPPPCNDDDNPGDRVGCNARPATRSHVAIPRLDSAAAALEKPIHLGSCAYAMRDKAAGGRGPELRVLMTSPRDLFVTVSDEKFATGAADWKSDDHLELWLGPNLVGLACLADAKEPMLQWGVSLADGKISSGAGDPKDPPKLERFTARTANGRQEATLHLALPGDEKTVPGIALAYVKGGKKQTIATGTVTPGDPATLGSIWTINTRGAICAEKDGKLELIDTGLPAAMEQ